MKTALVENPSATRQIRTLITGLLFFSWSEGCIGYQDESHVFLVVPENVQVRPGEDIFLRCVVRGQHTSVQWTKDGFTLGYGRGVPGYPRYTYEGDRSKGEHNLLIKSATSQDDGEYQCQVGPVPGMVSKIASANVTVLVPPGSISVAGRREETELEVTAGDPLTLECLVRDARPAPSVAWYRSGLKVDPALHKEEVLASGGEEEGRWNVKSRLVIRPSRDDDGRQFSCRALHPALEHSPANLVVSVVLDVLHAPSPPTISGYTTGEILVLGDERTLSCEVIGGNPRPRVVWYRHGRPLKTVQASSKRRVGRTKAAESRDEGVITVTQDVTATRREDGAMYECRVSNALLAQPLSSNVTLTVHYPPEGVTLSTPAVVGVDQRFSARCVTSPARPPAVITWMIQGILTTNVPSDVIEGEEGGWVTTSDLTSEYVNLENVSEVGLACRAHNPASDWVVSESSSITITRPPGRPLLKLEILEENKNALETVAARGQVSEGPQTVEPQQVVKPKHVVAGMTLRATCISVGGNPPPTITIYKRQERMKVTLNQTEAATQGQTRFRVRESDNGAEILCEVTNPATPAPLTTLTPIDVKFPPREVSGWVKPMNVEAGEEAALSCHTTPSRPRSTITWYSRAGVLQATSTVHSQAVFGGTITRSELTIRATADDNGRVVTCVAQNGLGSSVNVNITVSVLHGPVWVKVPSGRLDFLEGGDLVLTAVAAANPPTVSYSWWRGPEMIIGEGISEDGTGALRLNRIHRNQQGNYSVSAHTSRGTAHSDFFINVQYGPEDVVAATRVTLDKGGTTSVICSAKGNPTPNITWTRSNDNTSVLWWGVGEARLVVERASKEDTGVYLCKASNSVTTAPPAVTALVVTQPPTTPKEYQSVRGWAAIGGNGYLKCHVTAAPTPTFSWSVNGEAFVPNKSKYFVHHPELTDGVALWISVLEVRRVTDRDYTSYTCKAHNTEGEHSLSLTLGPPLPPQAPYNLTATVVTTSAVLSWRHSQPEDSVQGYTVKYHPVDSKEYKFQDVPGRGGTAATIKGLIASTQYAFAVQAYSEQGRSLYSAPFYVTTMRDAVEEAASSSTSTGSTNTGSGTQHRVPRLILIIICLTGAALLILNIVVVTCFLRRYIFKKAHMKVSERPSTSFDIATTATTPGSATCVDLVSSDDGSSVAPADYQIEREDCVEICVAREEAPAKSSSECAPMLQPPLPPRAHSEHVPSPMPRRVQPASSPHHVQCLLSPHHRCTDSPPYLLSREDPAKGEPPHLPPGSDLGGREDPPLPRHLPGPRFTQSLALRGGEVTVYDDISESENYEASSQTPDELPGAGEGSASAKHSQHRLNIPDVCPVTVNTYEPLLQHVRLQETILEYPEDHISVSSETSQNSRCSGCRDGSCSPYPAAVTPSHKLSAAPKASQKRPFPEPACPSTSAKPITQVIYHGQPHLQQQLEQERELDQSRQPKLYEYHPHLPPRLQQQQQQQQHPPDGRYLPHQPRRRQESDGHHYPPQPQKHVEEEYPFPLPPQYNEDGYMFHRRHQQPPHGDKDYRWYPDRQPRPEEKCPCFYNGHEQCVEEEHAPARPSLQSSYCQSKYNMRGTAAETISY